MGGTNLVEPQQILLAQGHDVPNNHLPVLLYRSVLPLHANDKAARFREHFKASGWGGLWTDTIYDYTHFHSNAHEALGIAEGNVSVDLGGDGGQVVHLEAGDLLVLPAGVGHRRITREDSRLKVIGAYPPGQTHYDMKRRGERKPDVAIPQSDPFYGNDGPLLRTWGA